MAIDTATTDLVVGLVEVAGDVREPCVTTIAARETPTRSHNELLVPTVNELLAHAGASYGDLSAVVAGCGPGPFTGLRVGMATASAYGQALRIPVHGICTHDAVAYQLQALTGADGDILVVTDARRREVYWAHYRAGNGCPTRVAGPAVNAPGDLRGVIEAGTADSTADSTGNIDVMSVPEPLRPGITLEAQTVTYQAPTPEAMVAVVAASTGLDAEPEPLIPLYLRRPDAKEPALKPPSPALRGL
nr:tRNA (adenosine(37)-N6)-threonylcarbamoyltransferase complex dimerization subunit type 1 TsaB [Corynebacterium aquatimens]